MNLLLRTALLVVSPAFAVVVANAWSAATIQPWLCLACAALPLSVAPLEGWRKPGS